MSPQPLHRSARIDWDRRANLLAGRMNRLIDGMARGMQAENGPMFTQTLDDESALDWWEKHRNDQFGAELIERWAQTDPAGAALRIQEIDNRLTRRLTGSYTPL